MARNYKHTADRIRVSHSQLETFSLCKRKWWFQKRKKIRTGGSASTLMGSIAHSCLERYLEGADEAIDIFPDGWHKTKEGTLTVAQQAKVTNAVNDAIRSGVVERNPGQQIEQEVNYPVTERSDLIGYIDVLETSDSADGWAIIDHKTSKSRRYLKNSRELEKNDQLARYAHAVDVMAKEQGIELEQVAVRHNQLVWDDGCKHTHGVMKRETWEKAFQQTKELTRDL